MRPNAPRQCHSPWFVGPAALAFYLAPACLSTKPPPEPPLPAIDVNAPAESAPHPASPPATEAPEPADETGVIYEVVEGWPSNKVLGHVAPCDIKGADFLCGARHIALLRDNVAQSAPDLEGGLPHDKYGVDGEVESVAGRWPDNAWLSVTQTIHTAPDPRRRLYHWAGKGWRELFSRRVAWHPTAYHSGQEFFWKNTLFFGAVIYSSAFCDLRSFGPAKAPFQAPRCAASLDVDWRPEPRAPEVLRSGELMLAVPPSSETGALEFWGEGGDRERLSLADIYTSIADSGCKVEDYYAENSRTLLFYGQRTDSPLACAFLYENGALAPLPLPALAGSVQGLRREDDGHLWLSIDTGYYERGAELWHRPPGATAFRRIAVPRATRASNDGPPFSSFRLTLRGPGDLWVSAAGDGDEGGRPGGGKTLVYRTVAPAKPVVCGEQSACPP